MGTGSKARPSAGSPGNRPGTSGTRVCPDVRALGRENRQRAGSESGTQKTLRRSTGLTFCPPPPACGFNLRYFRKFLGREMKLFTKKCAPGSTVASLLWALLLTLLIAGGHNAWADGSAPAAAAPAASNTPAAAV